MESQSKAYVNKNAHNRTVYQQYKKSYLEMQKTKMKIDAEIQREKTIMNRLKQAYK